MTIKDYKGAAVATTTTGVIGSGLAAFGVADAAGYPAHASIPFVVTLRRGTAFEEKMLVLRSGNSFTPVLRGYDDTVEIGHPLGSSVEHTVDAATLKEANHHVNDDTLDDHGQYLTVARHDLALRHPTASLADAAVTTAKLADAGVTTAKLVDQAVNEAKLADAAVTGVKLAPTAVDFTKLPAAVPRGVLGFVRVVAAAFDQPAALTDLPGMSKTFTVASGRLCRVTGHISMGLVGSGPNTVFCVIREGAVEIGRVGVESLSPAYSTLMEGGDPIEFSAGVHTVKLSTVSDGGAPIRIIPDAGMWMLIEDIGVLPA